MSTPPPASPTSGTPSTSGPSGSSGYSDPAASSGSFGTSASSGGSGTPHSEPPIAAPFFNWLRRLGIVRGERWVAGVCSGIANRIGIDPVLVRAAAIVIAVFGGPLLFFYGAAWLLLPDADGDIVLERALHRGWSPALAGIVALIIVGCTPLAGGVWWFGGHFGPDIVAEFGNGPAMVLGIFKALWILLIIALCIWGAVALAILAKRNGLVGWKSQGGQRWTGSAWTGAGGREPGGTMPYGQTPAAGAQGGTTPSDASQCAQTGTTVNGNAAASSMGTSTGSGDGTAGGTAAYTVGGDGTTYAGGIPGGAVPGDIPGAESFADSQDAPTPGQTQSESFGARFAEARSAGNAWRQDWYAQRNQWRQGLAEDRARIRAQRRAEADKSVARAAQWKIEREAYRAAHPHTPGWYFSLTLGLALLAGGVMAYCANWWFGTDHYRLALGLGASLLVIGAGMMVAALGRRHATALGWIGLVVLAALLAVGGRELGAI